ncbi:hypothetical protein BH23PAT1_BH23PAT1_0140 [soil metagenome]
MWGNRTVKLYLDILSRQWLRIVTIIVAAILAVLVIGFVEKPAEAASSTAVEAERMDGAGKVFRDRSASRNKGRVFLKRRSAAKTFRGSIARIYIRAKADRCKGSPRMKVMVDGRRVMVTRVKNTKRWRYYKKAVRRPAGKHRVRVKFTNDRKTRRCDRNLRVDKLIVKRQPRPVALGVMVDGGSASGIDRYTKLVGRAPSHVMFFRNWEHDEFPTDNLNEVVSRGAMPIVTWVPKDPSKGVNQPEYSLSTIVAGKHDAYIRRWAKGAASWDQPFYMRPMHEMNGTWSPWAVGVNGNSPTDYIRAWRRIYNIFESEGASNVRWVWSPNAGGRKFTDLYPGDAYVDWVALDGYNFGNSKSHTDWRSMREVFGSHYRTLAGMTRKPMMIAETSSAESGGSKADWIRNSLFKTIPNKFPRVKAVTWFNKDKETDWRVNSSSKALDAYRKVATSGLYKNRLR